MHVNDGHRRLLHDQMAAATSPHAAEVLMALLPPAGWADLATKQDVAETAWKVTWRVFLANVSAAGLVLAAIAVFGSN